MARLFADENFNARVIPELARLGHDVFTVRQVGLAGRQVGDPQILAEAIVLQRAVLTHNRRHFVKLHKKGSNHFGIVICTNDRDVIALAQRIHQAVLAHDPLNDKLVRVNLPSKP